VAKPGLIIKLWLYLLAYWLVALSIAAFIGFLAGVIGAKLLVAMGLLDQKLFYFIPAGFTFTFIVMVLPYLFTKSAQYWSAYRTISVSAPDQT
jgi:hypothetical protein